MFYVWGWLFAYKSPRMSEVLLDCYLFTEVGLSFKPRIHSLCILTLARMFRGDALSVSDVYRCGLSCPPAIHMGAGVLILV